MIQFLLGAIIGGAIVGILAIIMLETDKDDDWYDS